MVAIVSGNSLGLSLTSWATLGQKGGWGSSTAGRSGEQAYVNIATGNLVLQRQDDFLASLGQGLNVVRTYNSAGQLNDDNGDNWSVGIYNQPLQLTDTVNTAGSTITRIGADGAASVYTYHTTRQLYVSTDGAGAHDTIAWDAANSLYVWTEGSSGAHERYDANANGRLISRTDANGNTTSFAFGAGGLLQSVTTSSGETTYYDYTGNQLQQVRVVAQGNVTTTRVHYSYDGSGRLSTVTVDLSPQDNSTATGGTYQTTYTYDGASKRVASVSQSDGTRLDITYVLVGSEYRVATIGDAAAQVTSYSYDTVNRRTTLTDPLGVSSRYSYDTEGQLIQVQTGITAAKPLGLAQLYYAYDADGNLTSVTDGLGHTLGFQYDDNGNQTLKADATGNTVTSTYDSRNQLLTETITGPTGGATSLTQSLTTRFVYDATGKNQLRFVISAEGRVTEHRYDAFGQRTSTIEYGAAAYDVSGLASTAAPSEAQLTTWASAQDLSQGQRTNYAYDFRGQLNTRTVYSALDAAGNGSGAAVTTYVYSQAGELLQTIQPLGATTTYVYDGLGRVLTTTAPSSDGVTANITTTTYQDSLARTTVTLANGLSTVSTYDVAGRLVSVMQSSAGSGLGTTQYTYDQNNRLVTVQDPTGVRNHMVYDDAGRKIADIDGTGAVTEYVYNANNLLTQTIAYAQKVSPASPPTIAQIHALAHADDRMSWRIYDAAQRLVWQVDALGYVTQTDYDSASRIVAVTSLVTPINTALLGDATKFVVDGGALTSAGAPDVMTTAISLQVSQNSTTQGTPITLTAMVMGNSPDGMVTFYNGAAVLGTANLVNGIASLVVGNLPAGLNGLRAQYAGNVGNSPSTSATVATTVKAATTVTVNVPAQPVAQGETIALSAVVSGGGAGGTVTFFDGSVALGSAVVSVNGGVASAVLHVSTLGTGTHAITAVYSGDTLTSSTTAAAAANVQVVNPSAVALASSASQTVVGAPVNFTATVNTPSGQPQATGSVAFYDGTTLLGTVAVSNGAAVFNTVSLSVGLHSLTAVYQGDAGTAGSTSATLGQAILPVGATTVVLTPSHVQLPSGSALTLNAAIAAVAPGGAALAGTVTFYDGVTNLGTVNVVNGAASLVLGSVAAGNHAYRAVYSGDTADAGSSSASVAVAAVVGGATVTNPGASSTSVTLGAAPASVVQGGAVTLTAALGGATPTGTVTFVSGAHVLGTAEVINGVATLVVNSLAVGSHQVQASYSGDVDDPAGISTSAVAVNVAPVATTFNVTSSAPTAVKNSPVVLTAQLAGSSSTLPPTGNVSFYSGVTLLGTVALVNGVAALSVGSLAVGTNNITVQYGGDSKNAAGTSAVLAQTITPAPAAISLSASASNIQAGQSVTLTANLGTTVTGTVTFFNGLTALGTVAIVNGVASLATGSLAAGTTANITAVYSGDAANASSASAVTVVAVGPAAGSTAVAVSASYPQGTSNVGSPVTLTANLNNAANVSTTGVSFSSGTVTKTGANGYNASIRSTVGYTGGARVSFTVPTAPNEFFVGLNTDPATSDDYQSIDWAMHVSNGAIHFYNSGGYLTGVVYAAGDALAIEYDGTNIKFLRNAVVQYQQAAVITQPLYLDSSIYYTGATFTNLQFKNGAGQGSALVPPATGTVTFFNGQTSLGTASVVNGVASITTSVLPAGQANITAVYNGDAANSAAVSPGTAVSINGGVQLSSSSSSIATASPVTLTANLGTLNNLQSMTTTTGNVTVSGSTVTNGVGTSTIRSKVGYKDGASVSFVAPQTSPMTVYAGLSTAAGARWDLYLNNGQLQAYQSVYGTQVDIGTYVAGDTLSIEYDGANILFKKNGQTLNAPQASITEPLYMGVTLYQSGSTLNNLQFKKLGASGAPGTVTFFNGQTNLGTAAVVGGVASITTAALSTAGTASITAVYSGDIFNTGTASTALPITVVGTSAPANSAIGTGVSVTPSSTAIAGGTPLTLTANIGNVQSLVTRGVGLAGSTVTKPRDGAHVFDSSIRSTVGYTGGASVSFVPQQANRAILVGLSTDASTGDSYNNIDWAIQARGNGVLEAYSNGVAIASMGPYAAGDTLAVEYSGGYVRFLKNGVVLHQVAASISQPLYLDSTFAGAGGSIANLQFKNAAGQDMVGTGVPPTGTVTFYNGSVSLGTVDISAGAATLTTSALTSSGTANIFAVYNGDANNPASRSATTAVAVTGEMSLSVPATGTSTSPVPVSVKVGNTQNAVGAGVTVTGNSIAKTTVTNAWDASIRSLVGYTGRAQATFVPQQSNKAVAVGLNTDPTTSHHYNSIDWALLCKADGTLEAVQNGVVLASLGTYTAGDVLSVYYDGSYIYYTKNGQVMAQQAVTITAPLYLDTAFYDTGAAIRDLKFKNAVGEPLSLVATPNATGTVSFYNGQNHLYTVDVVNGVASMNYSFTTAGTYNITAVYNGDASHVAQSSAAAKIVVDGNTNPVAPTPVLPLPVTASSSSIAPGDPVTLTMNLGDTQNAIATGTYQTGGNVSRGDGYGFNASFHSKVGFAGGASVSFRPSQYDKVLAVGLNAHPETSTGYTDMDWAMVLVVNSPGQGSIQIYRNGAYVTTTGYYHSSHTLSIDYDGSFVRFKQNGAVIYQEAATITQPLYMDSTFFEPYCGINSLEFKNGAGQAVALDSRPSPSGTVTFFDGDVTLGTSAVVNGSASLATTALTRAGTANVRAVYSGDTYRPKSTSSLVPVTVRGAISLASSHASVIAGTSTMLTATMDPAVTGTVTFFNGTTSLGTATVVNGVATLLTASLTRNGTASLTAVYNGNGTLPSSASSPVAVVVSGGTVTSPPVTLNTSTTSVGLGGTVNFTASVGSPGTFYTSNMVEKDGVYSQGPGSSGSFRSLVGSTGGASASLKPMSLAGTTTFGLNTAPGVGPLDWWMQLNGGYIYVNLALGGASYQLGNYDVGDVLGVEYTGSQIRYTKNGAVMFQTAASGSQLMYLEGSFSYGPKISDLQFKNATGQGIELNPTPAPSGTVTFFNGGVSLGTATLVNGQATFSSSALPSGTANITAVYSGDSLYSGATSSASQVTVGGGVTLSASSTSVTAASPVTLTANLSGLNTLAAVSTTTNVTFSGGTITKTGGVSGQWDASIRSTVGFRGGASVSFTAPQVSTTNALIGLNTDPETNNSYETIDWAWGLYGNQMYVHAGSTPINFGTFNAGDSFKVEYDGVNVRFLRNGSVMHQVAATITQPLYLDSSFQYANATFSNLQFQRLGSTVNGSVTFFNGNQSLGTANVVNGTASLVTNALVANGTANITAVFSGDALNDPGASATLPIVVSGASGPATTTTTLTVSPTALSYADSTLLTATIAGGTSATGSVMFYSGSTFLGTSALVNGQATWIAKNLPVGNNGLRAVYTGDAQTAGSASAIVSQTVTKTASTVGLSSVVTSRTASTASVTFSVTLTGTNPSGTVTFYSNGIAISGAVAVVNGIATFSTTLPLGSATVTAQYSGDANNATGSSAPAVLSTRAPSVITVAAPVPTTVVYGTAVTLKATAYYSASSPGTVTFYSGSTLLGVAAVQPDGTATLVTSTVPVGTAAITAAYSGNADHDPVTQVGAQQVTVTGATTTALTVSHSITPYGSTVFLNATVSASGWSTGIGGTVSFYNGATLLGTAAVTNGVASFSASGLATGTNQLTAVYNGSGAYEPSMSANANAAVSVAPAGISLSTSASSVAVGNPLTLTAQVSGIDPGGMVTFLSGSTVLGTAAVVAGVATLVVANLPSGGNVLRARYEGDARNGQASSAAVLQTVGSQPAAALDRTSAASVAQAGNIVISVAGSSPSGTVTLFNGGVVVGVANVVGGVATLSARQLPAGTHNLMAIYSGDAANGASQLQFGQTVTASLAATSVVLTGTRILTNGGFGISLIARVDGLNPGGTVTFYRAGVDVGTVALTYGLASLTLDTPLSGAEELHAVYNGDSANDGSTSAALVTSSGSPTLNVTYSTQDRAIQQVYDRDGLLRASVDGEGYLTEYQYDAKGQLFRTTRYYQPVSGFTGPASIGARLATARQAGVLDGLRPAADARDAHTACFYDARGHKVGELDAEGYLTQHTFDANGNLTQSTRFATPISAIATKDVTAATTLSALAVAASAGDRTTISVYDALNRLSQQTDPEGTVTQVSYDSVGNLVKKVLAAGTAEARNLHTRYDVQGRVIGELTAEGGALLTGSQTPAQVDAIWAQYGLSHAYDAAGRRISTTDQYGNKTLFFYDSEGRLTHTVNALGEIVADTYNAFGQLVSHVEHTGRMLPAVKAALPQGGFATTAVTNAVNAVVAALKDVSTSYTYDVLGRLQQKTQSAEVLTNVWWYYDPVSGTTQQASTQYVGNDLTTYLYNAFGEEISRSEKGARETAFTVARTSAYDRRGLTTSATVDPAGVNATTAFTYDAFGRVSRVVDAMGNATQYVFDRLGRTINTTDPLNAQRHVAYDAFGRVLSKTDALGHTTTYEYNLAQRSIKVTTPEGAVMTTRYTRHGQVLSVVDARLNTTSFTYDADGHLTATNTPLTATGATYDRAGRLLTETDANGNVVWYEYDAASRVLRRRVDPTGLNLITSWEYDGRGEVIRTVDANGVATVTAFDPGGHVASQTVDPTGLALTTSYQYDIQGNTVKVTNANGVVTQYTYDKAGRRTLEQIDPTGDNFTRSFVYDKNDNLVSSTDGAGNVTRYAYDANNRLVYTVDGAGGVRRNTYDAEGQVIRTVAYANTISISGLDAGAVFGPMNGVLGTIESRLAPDALRDVVEHRVYDRDGRMTATVNGMGNVVKYSYDANGNVVERVAHVNSIAMSGGSAWTPGTTPMPTVDLARDEMIRTFYDELNRAILALDGAGGVIRQSYDGNGNVLQRTAFATAIPSTLTGLSTIESYLALYANPAKDQKSSFIYDKADRLIWTMDGAGAVTHLKRDGNGNVVKKVQFANALAAGSSPDAVTANARDRATDMVYDAANRLTYTVDALGYVTYDRYDKVGNLISRSVCGVPVTPPNAQVGAVFGGTLGVYTAAVIQTAVGSAWSTSHRSENWYYNARNDLEAHVDRSGAITHYVRDGAGSILRTVQFATSFDFATLASLRASAVPGNVSVHPLLSYIDGWAQTSMDRIDRQYFDGAGRVIYSVDSSGRVTRFTYDGVGRITAKLEYGTGINEASLANRAAYPTLQTLPVTASPSIDRSTTYVYDGASRTVSTTDAIGGTESFTYDGAGRKLSYTNAKSATWTYEYDATGRMVLEHSPPVAVTSVSYVGIATAGGWVETTNTVSLATRLQYDALGNLLSRTEAYGDPKQRTTQYEYDRMGRQVKTIFPVVGVYDAAADPLSTIGFAGPVLKSPATALYSTTTYDAFGDAVSSRDTAGFTSYKTYDAGGRMRYEVDALGYVTRYGRNAFGDVTELTRYAQQSGLVAGAPAALTTGQVDIAVAGLASNASNRVLYTTYDAMGRALEITEPSGYNYDPTASGASQYGSFGKVTQNTYNVFGDTIRTRVLINSSTDSWSTTNRYYDRAGREIATVDAENYVTRRTFELDGSLKESVEYALAISGYNGNSSVTLGIGTYDASSLAPASSEDDRRTSYVYDRLGRKTSETKHSVEVSGEAFSARQNLTTSYAYDAVGNLVTTTDATGGITRSYYDVLGRVTATGAHGGAGTDGAGITLTEFLRDAHGNVVSTMERHDGASSLLATGYTAIASGNDRKSYMLYDAMGRVIQVVNAEQHSSYMSYDERGNVAKEWQGVTDAGQQRTIYKAYSYDALGRLTETKEPGLSSSTLVSGLSMQFTSSEKIPYSYQVTSGSGESHPPEYATGYAMVGTNRVTLSGINVVNPTGGDIEVEVIYTTVSTEVRLDISGAPPTIGAASQEGTPRRRLVTPSQAAGLVEISWPEPTPNAFTPNNAGGIDRIRAIRFYKGGVLFAVKTPEEIVGAQISESAPTVASVKVGYNAFGEMVSRGDAINPSQEFFDYDNAGRLWRTNADDGIVKVYLHDAAGRRTSSITSAGTGNYNLNLLVFPTVDLVAQMNEGRRTDYTYDKLGRVIQEKGPQRQAWDSTGTQWKRPEVNRVIDRWGNVVQVSDPVFTSTRTYYEYNFNNQLIVQTAPHSPGGAVFGASEPAVTRITYDLLGREKQVRDANGHVTSKTYDVNNNVTSETNGEGETIHYEYNALGERARTIDARNGIVEYTYDKVGRLLHTTRMLQTGNVIESQFWDEAGRKTQQTTSGGQTTIYRYDLRGNITETRVHVEGDKYRVTRNRFSDQGKLIAQIDGNGAAASWTYDYFGQLTAHTDLGGSSFTYTYDNARQLYRQTSTRGQDLTYSYDAAGQLIRIVDKGLVGAISATEWKYQDKHTLYEYDLAGRRILEMTVENDRVTQSNRIAYDTMGRMSSIKSMSDFELKLETDMDGLGYMRRHDGLSAQYAAGGASNFGMSEQEYALWHYSNIGKPLGYSGGLEALSYITQPTGGKTRLQSITEVLGGMWTTNKHWGIAGTMLMFRITPSEAAQALGVSEGTLRSALESRTEFPRITPIDYDWRLSNTTGGAVFGGGVAVGPERANSIRLLWQGNMAAPRAMANAMLMSRLSIEETASALGITTDKVHQFFGNAGVQPWEYDFSAVLLDKKLLLGSEPGEQPVVVGAFTVVNQMVREKLFSDPQGLVAWLVNRKVSPEQVVAAAGWDSTPATPGYTRSLFYEYFAQNLNPPIPRTAYDPGYMAIPTYALVGPTPDLTQPIAPRWQLLNTYWTDYGPASAANDAKVIAQVMLHAKITVHEMATAVGWTADQLRSYFSSKGIAPINYDPGLSRSPGLTTAIALKAIAVAEAGNSAAGVLTQIQYDQVGNRKRITSTGTGSMGNMIVQDQSFLYDNADRVISAQGTSPSTNGPEDRTIVYDDNGNRTQVVTYESNGTPVTENYKYDALNRLTEIRIGAAVEKRLYDAAGRVLTTTHLDDPDGVGGSEGQVKKIITNRYNNAGDMLEQVTEDVNTGTSRVSYETGSESANASRGYDGAGNLLGYKTDPAVGDDKYYYYTYDRFDGYKEKSVIAFNGYTNGTSVSSYDANGFLKAVEEPSTPSNNRAFVNDANGIVLWSAQGTNPNDINAPKTYQLVVAGEVLGRYKVQQTPASPDLDFTYQPVGVNYPAQVPRAYSVTAAEAGLATTSPVQALQAIAKNVYGDAKLWFWIAEANNLGSSVALREGQILTIPNRVATIGNDSETFKPYDPSKIVGDTTPTIPVPKKKSNFFGKLVAAIVTVLVAIYAPQLLGQMNVLLKGAFVGVMASTAGQVTGMALGAQDSFSIKGVALGAIGGAITSMLPADLGSSFIPDKVVQAGFRAAVGNALTQGVGVATGLQSKFEWRGVAASAVGAGVGQAVGDALGLSNPNVVKGMSPGQLFGANLTKGLAMAGAAAVARGGKFAIQQVVVDAFGNALGSSLADSMSSAGSGPTTGDFARMDGEGYRSQPYDGGADWAADVAARRYAANPFCLPTLGRTTVAMGAGAGPVVAGDTDYYDDSVARVRGPNADALDARLQSDVTAIRRATEAKERAAVVAAQREADESRLAGLANRDDPRTFRSASSGYRAAQASGLSYGGGRDVADGPAMVSQDVYTVMGDYAGTTLIPVDNRPAMGHMDQMTNLSNALHVSPGFMKMSYDRAVAGLTNVNNSWVERGVNLMAGAAMLPLTFAEEGVRGFLNIPSGAAGAIPQASLTGDQLGIAFDTSLPTDVRVTAGLRATMLGTSSFNGLAGAAVVLKPSFEIGMPPSVDRSLGSSAGHQYAAGVLEGGTGTAYAGHGVYRFGTGEMVVPQGTAITLPREGISILDRTGQYIERGDWVGLAQAAKSNPRIAADIEGMTTYLPGARVPDYVLSSPRGLVIYQNSATVSARTPLSSLMEPNMGCVQWAACTAYGR